MDIRRFVLRASLTCLGITAASAIVMLFMPLGGIAGRLSLTGLIASAAGGLSWPFAAWASREDARWGGLAGVIVICAELLLTLVLIWGSIAIEDEVGGTMIDIVIAALPCIIGARVVGKKGTALAGATALGVGIASLAVMQYDTWSDGGILRHDLQTSARLWSVNLVMTGCAAAIGLVRPRSGIRWPLLGTALALVSAVMIGLTIGPGSYSRWDSDPIWLAAWALLGFAYAIGGANLLLLPKLANQAAWYVQLVTAGFALLTATLFALMLWLNDPSLPTMLAASSIALFCGVSAVLIISRFMQQPTLALDRSLLSTIEVTCPRCKRRGPIRLGESACDKCGLRFKIEVEEPRCPTCAQLLYGLTTDRCPECGTLITEPVIS